jgi:signal transduction histidine kinase
VILKQQEEACSIQESSSKLLNYFVNDLLSYAQINSGKFRKNLCSFDLKNAVSEIVGIMEYKAELIGIKLSTSFSGFMDNFLVCSDEQRL